VTVRRAGDGSWTEAVLQQIDGDTGLVAISNCHWTDGSLIDLEQVSGKTREVGAKLVIDASQSLGAYPLDVRKIRPDFLVTVGYKWLMGPYNLGYLYADPKYTQAGRPIEFSWMVKAGSDDFTRLVEYTDDYKPGARRFDAGEFASFIHIPMATAALTQITTWGVENIQETLSGVTGAISDGMRELGWETPARGSRVGHMLGIRFLPEKIDGIREKLVENSIYISFRGSSMRIAPHLYNDERDVQRLLEVLGKVG
jgi:selenocysteine lyase/cysteine desulfurase